MENLRTLIAINRDNFKIISLILRHGHSILLETLFVFHDKDGASVEARLDKR